MNTAAQVDSLIVELKSQPMMMSERIWLTATACVGQPYVLGAWGALCTPSERRKRLGYNPQATTIKTKCKGFDSGNCNGCQWYPDGERTRCWDCRGFTDWCLMQYGFDLWGDIVSTQWGTEKNWYLKGSVKNGVPENILVCLFKYNGSKWTHTGFGFRGQVCDCSGTVKVSDKRASTWTHWAVPRFLEEEYKLVYPVLEVPSEPKEEEPVNDADKNDHPKLQKGDTGDAVRELQHMLMEHGYSLPKFGADGDFGNETLKAVKAFQKSHGLKEDGIVGRNTWAELTSEPVSTKIYSIKITGLSKEQAEELEDKYGGVITAE